LRTGYQPSDSDADHFRELNSAIFLHYKWLIHSLSKVKSMPLAQFLFVTTAASAVQPIQLKSPVFSSMGKIPVKYTSDGPNISPPLTLDKIPSATRTLVLLVEDPNAPVDTWVHWLVWNIAPTTKINEGTIPGTQGLNSFMQHHYKGPCPPTETRNYFFKVYAIDKVLPLSERSTKYDVMKAMKDHVVGYGELQGNYTRSRPESAPRYTAPDIYC
jgi:Raf kinase inhibitor-like YbhB/YbcL family protein